MAKKQNSNPDSQSFIRAARRQIVRSAVFAAAAMGVIVFACYAWFAGNSSVSGTIGSIQMLGNLYELAGEGTSQDDTGYGVFYNEEATKRFSFHNLLRGDFSTDSRQNLEATGSQQAIRWRLNDNSKIGNYGDGSSGLLPGSSGKLEFYVIPKVTGTLQLNFQLDFNLYNIDGTLNTDGTLKNLIKGHLMFYVLDKNGNKFWVSWDENGIQGQQFEVLDKSAVGVPQLMTLYWKWTADFDDLYNDNDLQAKIAKNAELLFLSSNNTALTPGEATNYINESHLDTLSKFYDRADRYIGEHPVWLEVKLSADLDSNSTNN